MHFGALAVDGSDAIESILVTEEYPHEQYGSPGQHDNDIMLILLASASTQPIATWNQDPAIPTNGQNLTAGRVPIFPFKRYLSNFTVGFGHTQFKGEFSPFLRKVDVPAVSHEICFNTYGGITEEIMVCAGT